MSTPVDVVAALDVGGTRIKGALVAPSLTARVELVRPTPAEPALGLTAALAEVVEDLAAAASGSGEDLRVVGGGVVVPGLVDEVHGTGVLSVNLGWRDLPVTAPLAARLGVPVTLGHDVRAGLLAETRAGAARGARNAIFVPVGTGIAGALLLDGRVVRADGYAGELGHVVVEPDGERCACGARGCLETVSSGAAIRRHHREATGLDAAAEVVAARAAAGDGPAARVWARAVRGLARALAATVSLTGVELVLLGGGVAESGEALLGPLRDDLGTLLTFQRVPRVERAALGDRAGCIGAACLAWDAR